MKKLFLSLIVMMITMTASAQMPQFDPEQIVKMQVDAIKEKCKLTDDQYKAVYELQLTNTKEMMAEMQGGGMPDFEKMRKRNEELNKKIKAVLSEEQGKAYDEYVEEFRKRMQQMGGGFGR